jgi:hypothetical protein
MPSESYTVSDEEKFEVEVGLAMLKSVPVVDTGASAAVISRFAASVSAPLVVTTAVAVLPAVVEEPVIPDVKVNFVVVVSYDAVNPL